MQQAIRTDFRTIIVRVETEISWALRLLARLPGAALPGCPGSQLARIAPNVADTLRPLPLARDIDRADRIFSRVLDTLRGDPLSLRLVFGRAVRKGWKELQAGDDRYRSIRHLQRIYDEAIVKIALSNKSTSDRKKHVANVAF